MSKSPTAFFPETAWNPLALHRLIGPGLGVARLAELAAKLDLKLEDLALRCGISRPTLHRRKAGHQALSSAETDVLLRYAVLFKQAAEVFEDETAARQWLKSPQYGLDRAVPLDLAETTVGFREVEKLLTRIDHGVYA
jgi:putative toxin-antitoxin system antitoxin component (TIGR02293 family)